MKDKNGLHNLIVMLIICALIGIAVFVVIKIAAGRNDDKDIEAGEAVTEDNELAQRMIYYPENVNLGDDFSNLSFTKEDGSKMLISDKSGKYLVVTYWASYCDYCKAQLEHMDSYLKVLEGQDIDYLLVDKLDPEKETRENALAYLSDSGITVENVFDEDLSVYNSLGMKRIPTTFILDPDGKVTFVYTGVIDSGAEFESMLNFGVNSYAEATEEFIISKMLNEGGLRTTLQDEEGDHPKGGDVLAESEGLLMEYAIEKDNKVLFEEIYDYLERNMKEDGLFLWYSSTEGNPSSNAFLDDLRIYNALLEANEKWGGFDSQIEELENALVKYNFNKGMPRNFYDFKSNKMSDDFSLCYGDFVALSKLEERAGLKGLKEDTLKLVEEGYISDDFPFYYGSYSFKEKKYSQEDLNMAEAMYTLLNLAKAGELKDESVDWIMENLKGNGIFARYNINGEVVSGYAYESTAIYGIVALIGMEINNDEMVTKAVNRLTDIRIFDLASEYDGAFGNADGSQIRSFDQCLSLLVYLRMDAQFR